ncbi:MAG TPA: riboflavin synthase [Bryobacteraceae bacterium]|nr:riboflavin synthase [Bryobacteraceae bacterium]
MPALRFQRQIAIRYPEVLDMFTGIVEELGVVAALQPRPAGARLCVKCRSVLEDLRPGASIAVNGVCLTALDITPHSFQADLAPETLSRTNLGALQTGSKVNLERPLTLATRLSGHLVQGHVDATAEVASLDSLGGGNWRLRVRLPPEFARYLVHKGSIALDGISLTIAALEPGPVVAVAVIPHTFARTTLGSATPGARLNVEVDMLAKYVEQILKAGNPRL